MKVRELTKKEAFIVNYVGLKENTNKTTGRKFTKGLIVTDNKFIDVPSFQNDYIESFLDLDDIIDKIKEGKVTFKVFEKTSAENPYCYIRLYVNGKMFNNGALQG